MRHTSDYLFVTVCLIGLLSAITPNIAQGIGTCSTNEDCDDNNVCTNDWCDPGVYECFYTNVTGPCNDGNACTENDACSNGVCVGTAINCDDGNACTTDSCVNGVCQHDASGCECTEDSDCDDGNVCTNDWCDPAVNECFYTNNTDPCDDGDACTENDACSEGTCTGTAIDCNDWIECTVDSCVNGVCQHDASACECTETADCDDGNVCTNDWCDPAVNECFYTNNTDPCDDGDACTENDTCSDGTCVGTNTCSNVTSPAICAPASGATTLITCFALLVVRLYTRSHYASRTRTSEMH